MKINKLRIVLILLSSLLLACSSDDPDGIAPPIDNPTVSDLAKKEMRAVWVATAWGIDWPMTEYTATIQKQQYINYLETFKAHNINTVMVQIRPMADAFYKSAYDPWSASITGTQGKDPGYDVLQFMIEETHRRGLEFHAWMNPYRIASSGSIESLVDGHIAKEHREWTMTYDNLLLFRPAIPEVREHLVNVINEVITKYDVDGIHFDDYFYPYPVAGKVLDDQVDFEKYGSGYANIGDFRRGNVNKAIEDVSNLIKSKKPGVLFSVSPFSVNSVNNDDLYADVPLWCKKGWVDVVIPQLYASTGATYANFISQLSWWTQNSSNVPVLVGYALYKFGDTSQGTDPLFQTTKELETQFFYANRDSRVKGSVLYRAKSMNTNFMNIMGTLDNIYKDPAVVPFMGRKTLADPTPASNVKLSGDMLTWSTASDLRSVVYKMEKEKGRVMIVTGEKSYKIQETGDYVVTTLNRDNTESVISSKVTF